MGFVTVLRDAGFTVEEVAGGRLRITPASKLTDAQRAAITKHRDAILDELRDEADDAREYYEERAAVLEFCEGMSRPEAEAEARRRTVIRFKLNEFYGDTPQAGGGTYLSDSDPAGALAELREKYGDRLAAAEVQS